MHVRLAATFLAMTLPLAGCATVANLPAQQIGSATLTLANGQPAGVARIFATGDEVTLAAGLTVREVPIEFVERVRGDSKMSGAVATESLKRITTWGLRERRQQVRRAWQRR